MCFFFCFCSFNSFKEKTLTLTSVETQTSAWETSPNCRLLKIKEKEKMTNCKALIHSFNILGSYLPSGGSCLSDLDKPEWLW